MTVYGYFAAAYWSVQDVPSWEDCGRICNSTTPCKFWSWGKEESYNHNNCLLYETDIELDFNNALGAEGGKWADIFACRIMTLNEAEMSCDPILAINDSITFGLIRPT